VRFLNVTIANGGQGISTETAGNNDACYLGGGGIRLRPGGRLELDGVNILRSAIPGNGGGVCIGDSSVVTITGGSMVSNTAGSSGGAIFVGAGAKVFVNNLSIRGNRALIGGGVKSNGDMTITGADVFSNAATNVGGGIMNIALMTLTNSSLISNAAAIGGGVFNDPSGSMTISATVITGSRADRGGGIYNGGVLSVADSQVTTNTATSNGGGLFNEGSLILSNTDVRRNRAVNGGGIFNKNYLLAAGSGSIANNNATNGGGIYNDGTLAELSGANVVSNSATNGGGIFNFSGRAVITASASVTGNIANQLGGGVYNDQRGTFVAHGSSIVRNRANAQGGGVHNEPQAKILINNSIIASNSSNSNGGGIHTLGPSEIDSSFVSDNVAQNGAGLSARSTFQTVITISNSTIQSNSAAFNGGGIAAEPNALVVITAGSIIKSNTASSIGGGIYASHEMEIISSRVISNQSVNSAGGGIAVQGGRIRISSAVVASNTARTNGGGVANAFGTVFITNSMVATNTAQNGGGVYLEGGGASLTIHGSDVVSNTASINGGGILNVHPNARTVISNSRIDRNAAVNGGGIYNNGRLDTRDTTQIAHNTVGADGGGIYNNGRLDTRDTQIAHNTVGANGGALYNTPTGIATIEDTIIGGNNRATLLGGGLYNSSGGRVAITRTVVTQNTSNSSGAGVYNDGTMTITGGSVTSNTALVDGGGILNNRDMTITGTRVSGNRGLNGGGILNTGAMIIINVDVISNAASNRGGGVFNTFNLVIRNASIGNTDVGNFAQDRGGGLYNRIGSTTIERSALVNNRSVIAGGGAYIESGALTITNTTFSQNRAPASTGGGLHVESGSTNLTFATVASSTAGFGIINTSGIVQAYATLLAYNAGGDCSGNVVNTGHSMSSDITCGAVFTSTDPLLLPLAMNGGNTPNHALAPNSPALEQVPTSACTVADDQRFVSRPQGLACDIGAFELEGANLSVRKVANPSPALAFQTITYTVTITNAGPYAANSVVLSDALTGGALFGGMVVSNGFALQSSSSTTAVFVLPSLAANSAVTLVFTATAPAAGTVTNTVAVTSDNPDPNPANNTFEVSTPVIPQADLAVSKSVTPSPALAGQVVTYTVIVTNPSSYDANNIVVTDTLTGGALFGGMVVSNGFALQSSSSTTAVFVLPSLAANSAVTLVFTATAPVSGTTANTVVVTSDNPDPDLNNNSASTPNTPVTPAANLAASKSVTPSSALAGQVVTYTVIVTNPSPYNANNIVVTDTLTGGALFGGMVVSNGFALQSSSSTTAVFVLPSLATNSAVTLVFTATALAAGTVTNTVAVTSDDPDPNLADNTFEVSMPVIPQADLAVSKSVTPSPALAGQAVTYTVIVTNSGPYDANNIVVTDTLTGGALFGGMVVSNGFALQSSSSTTAVFVLPSLAANSAVTLVFTATAPAAGTVTNTVAVTSDDPDSDLTNNTFEVSTPVIPEADLAVSKSVTPSPALAGQVVTYTVTITNAGQYAANNIVVTDTLTGGALFGGMVVSNGFALQSSSSTTAVFVLPSLAANSAVTLVFTATAPVSGTTANTVVVTSDNPDPDLNNNSASTPSTPVTPVANLAVSKSVTPSPALAGQVVTYTVIVTNSGPYDANNIVVTDTLTGGALFGGMVVSNGFALQSSSSTTAVFVLPSLAANSAVTLVFTATAPVTGTTANTVVVTSDDPDPDLNNNSASTPSTPVTPVANLAVSKSVTPSPALAGQVVTYTVIVTNSGPYNANNIVVTDTLTGGALFGGMVVSNGFALRSSSSTTAVFVLPSLAANSAVTLVFTATAPVTGTTANTVVVTSDDPDPDPNSNSASTPSTPVTPVANLAVRKSATPSSVLAGQAVTYTVTVTNLGPSTATNIVITDVFQGGATFGGVIATSGGATLQASSANAVTFTISTLSAGAAASMTYYVIAPSAGVITNTATVAANQVDTDQGNNTTSVGTPVTPAANLAVRKSVTPSSALAGQAVTYTVTVTNLGPSTATNIVITDVFRGGATFGGVIATSGGATLQASSANAVTFTISTLSAGAAASMTYYVIAPSAGVITNTATVAANQVDTDQGNNSTSVGTPVTPTANLSISKAQSYPLGIGGTLTPSAPLTYTIRVTNTGPSTATNVVVTDVLPAGLTVITVTASAGWTCSNSGQTVTCTVGSLGIGANATIQIATTAPVTLGQLLTNAAVVRTSTFPGMPITSNVVSAQVQFRAFMPILRRLPEQASRR
jgi:uncharacterized repeat protein (TIGR01451 family)